MGIIFALIVLAVIIALPVMLAARMFGAANTGFGSALLAVFLAFLVSVVIDAFLGDGLIGFFVSGAIGALIYANILGTTFWRGLGISVVSTIILIGALIVLAGVFGDVDLETVSRLTLSTIDVSAATVDQAASIALGEFAVLFENTVRTSVFTL
ncbi:MAG: hypothetical protein AAGH76_11085 [Pseudomonadota bacterium]